MIETGNSAHYLLGEKKYTWFKADDGGEGCTIQSAEWVLVSRSGTIVASGSCELDTDGRLRAMLEPKARGDYLLTVTYQAGEEKKAVEVSILVT
ncbi:MAG: hypothetical protein PUC47_06530 [Oscillospiraceae bacterium]|nr:hypothetical protein [Oscillospiraceae bacterium]